MPEKGPPGQRESAARAVVAMHEPAAGSIDYRGVPGVSGLPGSTAGG